MIKITIFSKRMASTEKPKPRVIPTSPTRDISAGVMSKEQMVVKELADVKGPNVLKETKAPLSSNVVNEAVFLL